MGKVIHWELCKKLKFDHIGKYTNQNLSLKLKLMKFSATLIYKRFTKFLPEDQT